MTSTTEKPWVKIFFSPDDETEIQQIINANRQYAIIPFSNIETGDYGFTLFDVETKQDIGTIHWFIFGQELICDTKDFDKVEEFEAWLKEHRKHEYIVRSDDPETRRTGAICYCKVKEGRSSAARIDVELIDVRIQIERKLPIANWTKLLGDYNDVSNGNS